MRENLSPHPRKKNSTTYCNLQTPRAVTLTVASDLEGRDHKRHSFQEGRDKSFCVCVSPKLLMLSCQCDNFGRSESKAFQYGKAYSCKPLGTMPPTPFIHISLNAPAKTAAGFGHFHNNFSDLCLCEQMSKLVLLQQLSGSLSQTLPTWDITFPLQQNREAKQCAHTWQMINKRLFP